MRIGNCICSRCIVLPVYNMSPYSAAHRLIPYYIQQALSLIERPVKNGFMVYAGSLQVNVWVNRAGNFLNRRHWVYISWWFMNSCQLSQGCNLYGGSKVLLPHHFSFIQCHVTLKIAIPSFGLVSICGHIHLCCGHKCSHEHLGYLRGHKLGKV